MKRLFSLLTAILLLPSIAFAAFPAVTKGATSVIVPLAVIDSSSSTGARLASVLFNASGLICDYTQEGGTATSITLATMTLGTWATGGWIYNSTTKDYELGVPNAAFATGTSARWVKISCLGATNMLQADMLIPLSDFGPYSTGTAQAIAAGTITLASGDAAPDHGYQNGTQVTIDSATTGQGQTVCLSDNVNSTKVATLAYNWPGGTPTGTVKYSLSANGACKVTNNLPTNFSLLVIDGSGRVDLGKTLGTALASVAGYVGIDWSHINAPTTTQNLSGTTIATATSVTNGVSLSSPDTQVVTSGTASAGAAGSITLVSPASTTANLYVGMLVKITGGTGAGQSRIITAYSVGRVATVDWNWTTTPDNTSTYAVIYNDLPAENSSLQCTAASVQGNVTGSVGSVTGAVGSVTGNVGGNVAGSVASVTAQVTANVTGFDGTATNSVSELSALPSSTPNFLTMMQWLYEMSHNSITQTSSSQILQKLDSSTTLGTSTTSDNGTTFTRGKFQ